MASLPTTQRDQVKLLFGVTAIALAAFYWMYPYTSKNEQLLLDETHVTELEGANQKAAHEFASGSVEALRSQAAQTRSGLTVMRRLVPTGNEVPPCSRK